MFDYENLEDPARLFTSLAGNALTQRMFNPQKGLFKFEKLKIWEDPLCFNVHGVPGLGPCSFDVKEVRDDVEDADMGRSLFRRDEAIKHCAAVEGVIYAPSCGILYLEFNPPEYEQFNFVEEPLVSHRNFVGLFSLLADYAGMDADSDLHVAAREMLEFVQFYAIAAEVNEYLDGLIGGAAPQNLPATLDRWLWHILLNSDFDRGI